MSGLTRSIPQLLDKLVRSRISDMHVMLPAQVVSYDGTQFVSVNVMVQHAVWNDDNQVDHWEKIPTIPGVPVSWPRFGGFYLSGPINVGDEGMLIFSSTGIGEWRSTGQSSKPADPGRHTNGWPVFQPSLFNDTRTLPDATARAAGIVLGKEGSQEQLLIQAGLIQLGASGAQAIALKADLDAQIASLKTFATALTNSVTLANVIACGATLTTALNAAPPTYSTLAKAK